MRTAQRNLTNCRSTPRAPPETAGAFRIARKAILANGSVPAGREMHDGAPDKLRFWVATGYGSGQ